MFNMLFGRAHQEPLPPPSGNTGPCVKLPPPVSAKFDLPVAASTRFQFPNGLEYCGANILRVPAGKRLVLDAISFEGESGGGLGFLKATITTDGNAMSYIIPALNLRPHTASASVEGSASMRLGPGHSLN